MASLSRLSRAAKASVAIAVAAGIIGSGKALQSLPTLLSVPSINVVGGAPLRVGAQIAIAHGTWTYSDGEEFFYATNVDFAPSLIGPWTPQQIFTETFTLPPNALNLYVRVRERGVNQIGASIDEGITGILGPIQDIARPGGMLPYNDLAGYNGGNIQTGVPTDLAIRYGKTGWSIAATNLPTGLSISGGADSSTARVTGTSTQAEGIVRTTFTCSKSGETDVVSTWDFLCSPQAFTPVQDPQFTGALLLDRNAGIFILNQSALSSKAATKAKGVENQDVFRLALFSDGAGWSGDPRTGNRYRSELEFTEKFRAEETVYAAFRSKITGFVFPDIRNIGTAYSIFFQGHHFPPATGQFVPPWLGFVGYIDSADSNKRKFAIQTRWNNDSGVYNIDIFDGSARTVAGDLRTLKFSKPMTVRNGMRIRTNPALTPNPAVDVPDGTVIVSGGGTNVTEVVVNKDIVAGSRQILVSTNFNETTFGPFDLPDGDNDFQIEARPSLQGNGRLKVTFNGTVIVDVSNVNLGHSDDGELDPDGVSRPRRFYFKSGMYTSPRPMVGAIGGAHQLDFIMSRTPIPGLVGRSRNPFAVPRLPVLLDGLNDGGWTADKIEGAQALSLQGQGVSNANPLSGIRTNNAATAINMKDTKFVAAFVKPLVPWIMTKAEIQLGRDGTTGGGVALPTAINPAAFASDKLIGELPAGEWYPWSATPDDYAGLDTTPGKPSTRFRIYGASNQAFAHAAVFDMVVARSDFVPRVIFTFDDCENTHRSFLGPLFKGKNKPFHLYVCPDQLNISDNLSTQELLECYRDFGADLGYDSRMDGFCWPRGVRLARAAGKTEAQALADVLDQFAQIRAWLRANIGGGAPVRGEDHMCYAGSDLGEYPTNFDSFGEKPPRTLIATLNVTAGSTTVTASAAIGTDVTQGQTIYCRGSGGVVSKKTIVSIASDRLSMVLSGDLGFTGTTRATCVDETGTFYLGSSAFQAAMRAWGMKTARAGPSQSEDAGFFAGLGMGGYDMLMPSRSLSGMTDDNVAGVISHILDNARRGRTTVVYGHRADENTPTGQGINFKPSAMTTLFNAMVDAENAGTLRFDTPRGLFTTVGRGPNIPVFG